jgi:hypothetical protein
METLTDIRNQRQRLARYSCQARRSQAKKAKKILFDIRASLRRLDRMQDLIQAQQRKNVHE